MELARAAGRAFPVHAVRDAQSRSYAYCYPGAEHSLLLAGDRPAGRIMVERPAAVFHLVDISLLPEYRGEGSGTLLLWELIEECKASGGMYFPCMC